MSFEKHLQYLGVRPNLAYGQNFVVDRNLIEREVAYADVQSSDKILEIGPGIGNLTECLLQRAKHVVAIECDRQFVLPLDDLKRRYDSFSVLWGDALKIDFPIYDKVVANLPYKSALPLLFKLVGRKYISATLMVQLGLAKRICAQVNQPRYCRLSVTLGRLARVEFIEKIGREQFYPCPEVDSALIRVERIRPRFKIPSEKFFKHVLDALFALRGQTVERVMRIDKSKIFSERAIKLLPGKIRNKLVRQVTPSEFGHITQISWENGSEGFSKRYNSL